jgi:tRNA-specific 2-thiouridylase
MNSLFVNKPVAQTRVVVAMSGGVDSSVTAAMLKQEGYDVIGITMQLYDYGEVTGKSNTCCAGKDVHDAKRVASHIGIPHYVVDYESNFKKDVMEQFADSYIKGETPIPCVICNKTVKFRDMFAAAQDLDADALVTGHYMRWEMENGMAKAYRGYDYSRDQSYFLFTTTQEQLNFLRFPLGAMSKDETRKIAHDLGLPVASKPDSQDICFVPDGNYAAVVERLRPGATSPGNIVNAAGDVLGQHKGIIHYTIGQRRGLGIGGTEKPLYVVGVNAANNTVIVGPKEDLATHDVYVRDINWLGDRLPHKGDVLDLHFKIRNVQTPVEGTLHPYAGDAQTWKVELNAPCFGVAPGQACVFYDGDRLLGGGWIVSDCLK